MKWIVIVIFLLTPCLAIAEPLAWMKQTDPNSLGLYLAVSDNCPFQEEQLENKIEGEFLRARIKPTKSLDLNLTVNVQCMTVSNKAAKQMGYAVHYEIRYGTKIADSTYVLYESPNYGRQLIGDLDSKQYFIEQIRDDVSEALTAYLKENFE